MIRPTQKEPASREHPVTGEWRVQIVAVSRLRSVTNNGANALDVEQLHAPVAGAHIGLSLQGVTKEPPN